jgi:cellulose synthase/poly-beta-1,6-N-acetylglucosamine synthase-like glycosyltransferase
MELLFLLFVLAFALNVRASFKLGLDWKGMLTTVRFVRESYARLPELPSEEALEREGRAPVFLHLVPAYQEPGIAATVSALVTSRYPHGRLHVVVVTKEEEERAPHPAMSASTGELVRRLRDTLPPYQQKRLTHLVMPGPGRKAHQLNWALRPEALEEILGTAVDPGRVFVGVSDADSLPDPDTYRWIAHRELTGSGARAYQGITLSLGNYDRLPIRGKICAVQQSSIFIRVSLARLINEAKRLRLFARWASRAPRLARVTRPAFEFLFRRAQICLGHNQFVRLDTLAGLGGFPTSGATEDSTLGYALGGRGVLIEAVPMVELTDLPETSEKVIRQNARWYLGVLDDIPFLWRAWRRTPSAFNLAQLLRHVGNKVVEWPIAALVYPAVGYLGWYLAYTFRWKHPWFFYAAVGAPTLSLILTVWVGGIMTQSLIEDLHPYLPRLVDLRRRSLKEKFLGTFRCQTYWLLATRGAWRVLYSLATKGRYEAGKTDRVARFDASPPLSSDLFPMPRPALPPACEREPSSPSPSGMRARVSRGRGDARARFAARRISEARPGAQELGLEGYPPASPMEPTPELRITEAFAQSPDPFGRRQF